MEGIGKTKHGTSEDDRALIINHKSKVGIILESFTDIVKLMCSIRSISIAIRVYMRSK